MTCAFNTQEFYEHSWAIGKIEKVDRTDAMIRFESFENEDETPLVEACPLSCVRPRPVASRMTIESAHLGSEVDVFKDHVWWEGVIVRVGVENVDVRLHSDQSIQKELSCDVLRIGLVFEQVWYERKNVMQTEKPPRIAFNDDGVTTVECSLSQFEVEGASTACCIISMLNGLSVLQEPQCLLDWNKEWLVRTMDANVTSGGAEFSRLKELDSSIFTRNGYTNVVRICSMKVRGGSLTCVEHDKASSKSGFIEKKPPKFTGNAHNAAVLFAQVSEL